MPRHNDYEGLGLEDTVRNLRVLTDAPGELRYRQAVSASLDKVTDKLSRHEKALTLLKERQLSRIQVAAIVKQETAVLETKVETLSRMCWGLAGAAGVAIIGLVLTKVFK